MKDRKNFYTCLGCGRNFVTLDLCDGVTPASITCHVCNDSAWSALYPENITHEPTLFWFKPSANGIKKQTEWELNYFGMSGQLNLDQALPLQQEHVDSGGLLLAPSRNKAKEWSR